jgi:hypothetical protein
MLLRIVSSAVGSQANVSTVCYFYSFLGAAWASRAVEDVAAPATVQRRMDLMAEQDRQNVVATCLRQTLPIFRGLPGTGGAPCA